MAAPSRPTAGKNNECIRVCTLGTLSDKKPLRRLRDCPRDSRNLSADLALIDGLVVPPRVENVECPLLVVLHVRVTTVLHFLEMVVVMLVLLLMLILSLPPPPPVVPVASPRLPPLRHLHGDSEMDLIHRLNLTLNVALLGPKLMFAEHDKHFPSRSGQASLATAVTNITKPVTTINFGPSTQPCKLRIKWSSHLTSLV